MPENETFCLKTMVFFFTFLRLSSCRLWGNSALRGFEGKTKTSSTVFPALDILMEADLAVRCWAPQWLVVRKAA